MEKQLYIETRFALRTVQENPWSAIAARLPGRTDNEIKNVWHTHLKKRLNKKQQQQEQEEPIIIINNTNNTDHLYRRVASPPPPPLPPPPPPPESATSSDDTSSTTTTTNTCMKMEPSSSENNNNSNSSNNDDFAEIDDNFWTDVLSVDDSSDPLSPSVVGGAGAAADPVLATVELESSSSSSPSSSLFNINAFSSDSNNVYDNMDFWYNLFTKAGDSSEMLLQF